MLDVAECNINQIIVTRLNNLKKCSQASLPEYEIHFVTVVLTFKEFLRQAMILNSV